MALAQIPVVRSPYDSEAQYNPLDIVYVGQSGNGDSGGKISRAQVNRGYKVTDWSEKIVQLQRIELKKLGITERSLRSDTQGNFDELENVVNSNAGTTEAWYKQLSYNLAAETANRQAADEELEQKLRSEMAAGDKNLQSQVDDKASIEDLNDAKAEWLTRAKHIALGTDLETVEAAVVMVLHKRGMI